jgi:hypothetical protein
MFEPPACPAPARDKFLKRQLLGSALEDISESPEQEARENHRGRQRQHPGHEEIAYRPPLQPGVIRRHRAGDPG